MNSCFPVFKIKKIRREEFTYVREEIFSRSELSGRSKYLAEDEWFLGGAGGGFLFNQRYMPLVQRTQSAPINPGFWTLGTGLIDNLDDLKNWKLLLREAFEEILIIENKKVLVPQIDGFNSTGLVSDIITRHSWDLDVKLIEADLFKSSYLQNIHLFGQDFKAFAHYNTSVKTINLMFVVEIQVPNVAQLEFRDGEFSGSVSLNRNTTLVDLGQWNEFKKQADVTPHADYVCIILTKELFNGTNNS